MELQTILKQKINELDWQHFIRSVEKYAEDKIVFVKQMN